MEKCEYAESCAFPAKNPDSELKSTYCESNSLHCARYMVIQAVSEDAVPEDLLPTDKTKAYGILATNG